MSWHVEKELLHRYQEGAVGRVTATSLEAHVTECEQCRAELTIDADWLEQSWAGIADRVEPGRPHVVERVLVAVRVRQHLARVISLSPAFRISFVLAVVLVLGFAVAASRSDPEGWVFRLFLILAPLLPVAGIAVAYGYLVDPVHEWTLSSPIDSFRLLLLRAVTVLIVSAGLGLMVWPLVEAPAAFGPAAWLAPALALTVVTLAVASRFEMWLSAAIVAGGWVAAIAIASVSDLEIYDTHAQYAYLTAAAAAALVVVLRRDSYDREGGHR